MFQRQYSEIHSVNIVKKKQKKKKTNLNTVSKIDRTTDSNLKANLQNLQKQNHLQF